MRFLQTLRIDKCRQSNLEKRMSEHVTYSERSTLWKLAL